MSDNNITELYGALSKFLSAISPAIDYVRELDASLTDLKQATGASDEELKQLFIDSENIAKELNTTTKEIINQTTWWKNLGYNIKDAQTLAKNTSILSALSPGLGTEKAASSLLNTIKAFELEPDNSLDSVISKINITGQNSGLSNTGITDILSQTSSAMAEAGNTLDETIALGASAMKITGSADTASDILNSITGNIQDNVPVISELTKTPEMPDGISLFTDETNETYKTTYRILSDIASVWEHLDSGSQAEIISTVSGGENIQPVTQLIESFDTARQSVILMLDSAGSAMQSINESTDGLNAKLNTLSETGAGIAQNLFGEKDMETATDAVNALGNALEWITGKLGLFGTMAAGAGLISGIKNIGKYVQAHGFQTIIC
ncbi:MAG: phage tail tape measure protein [Lachnospiraceae bacterium]|jgi:hypothetical protein